MVFAKGRSTPVRGVADGVNAPSMGALGDGTRDEGLAAAHALD